MIGENVNFAIALVAGVISFISPCILPVIPSYLAMIGGITYGDLTHQKKIRWTIFAKTLLFVGGFTVVFVVLGTVFSSIGMILSGANRIINYVAGSVVMLIGLNYIFNFVRILNIERRFHFQNKPAGGIGPALLGMAFGAGWTPCIGPILASILFLAGSSAQGLQGTMLLLTYSLGLGIPFILAGVFFCTFQKHMAKLKPHFRAIRIMSGVFLMFVGTLIFFGSLTRLNAFFFQTASRLDVWAQESPWIAHKLFSLPFFIFLFLLVLSYIKRVTTLSAGASTARSLLIPARLILILSVALFAVLSFTGILSIPRLVTSWLSFQGI